MGFKWLNIFSRKKEKEQPKEEEAVVKTTESEVLKKTTFVQSSNIKIVMSNGTIVVILPNGATLVNSDASEELFNKVNCASSIEEIENLMLPSIKKALKVDQKTDSPKIKQKAEKVESVVEAIEIGKNLLGDSNFEQRDGKIFVVGSKIPLPPVMVDAFSKVIEDSPKKEALLKFWYWLSLNKNPESIRDAYKFIEKNDVKVTPNGLLVLYRSILKVEDDGNNNKELLEFASAAHAKIKLWKKSPKNFTIYKKDGKYIYLKDTVEPEEGAERIGNLEEVHKSQIKSEENTYTDGHTRQKKIKIGHVYQEDEANIDTNNKIGCGRGLHVGSRSFGISSFGDTKVMCLVNPMKIRAVPLYEYSKMRVQEMFVAAILEDDNGKYPDEDVDLVELDNRYFNISLNSLKEKVKKSKTNLDDNGFQINKEFKSVEVNTILDYLAAKEVVQKKVKKIK